MSAIDDLFQQLSATGQTAFMPFITAGDPDLSFTRDLLLALNHAGCHLVELGIPYSDPIADGPVIQESYTRALHQGVTLQDILAMLAEVSPQLNMPLVAMVSYSIILRCQPEHFVQRAQRSGICGAIVPDLPMDESGEFARICSQHDFNLVQLITPTTPDKRALEIANAASGFVYYVSVAGITGERNRLPAELVDRLDWLKQHCDKPICVGFGISEPMQAEQLKRSADGIIVGSAIVKRIAEAVDRQRREQTIHEIQNFSRQMVQATGP